MLLLPEERGYIEQAVPKRAREFAAGRLCARAALAQFGFAVAPIHVNSDGSPRWPAGMVGSITHTEGFFGAAVAEQQHFLALGLDAEIISRVIPDVWTQICTPAELVWVDSLAEREKARAAAMIFAAKEAVYKCFYSMNSEWLDFHDVTIVPEQRNLEGTSYTIRALRRLQLLDRDLQRFEGRFLFQDHIVLVGSAIRK